MRLKCPELHGIHGKIGTAPKSATNTHRGLTHLSGTSRKGLPVMVPKTCSVEGCETAKYCRGWCVKHYNRWRSHGDPLTVITQTKTPCMVDACANNQHAHGYCDFHLHRFKTYGDALAEGKGRHHGRNRLATPGYDGVHKRLHREKGKASVHPCADCGERAHEWSYDGGWPNELYEVLEKVPVAYSTDQSRYSPRCRKCHRNRDESIVRDRGKDGRWVA